MTRRRCCGALFDDPASKGPTETSARPSPSGGMDYLVGQGGPTREAEVQPALDRRAHDRGVRPPQRPRRPDPRVRRRDHRRMTPTELTRPPLRADEAESLLAFLDYHRDYLRRKTEGLTQEQLAQPLAPEHDDAGRAAQAPRPGRGQLVQRGADGQRGRPRSGRRSTGTPTPTGSGAPPPTTRPEELRRAVRRERRRRPTGCIRQALAEGGLDALVASREPAPGRGGTSACAGSCCT